MKQHNNKKYSVKKSSGGQSKELLKSLQKLITDKTGTISYYFVEERIEKIHSHDLEDLQPVKKKAILHTLLTSQAIEGKSPTDLITMFETTKWDLGANYFVVN